MKAIDLFNKMNKLQCLELTDDKHQIISGEKRDLIADEELFYVLKKNMFREIVDVSTFIFQGKSYISIKVI